MLIVTYKLVQNNGITYYHPETSDEIIEILENARLAGTRVRLWYGNISSGRAWGDCEEGKLGRSGGAVQVPTITTHRKCLGGREVLTHCIVKVEYANKQRGGVLWTHPDFKRADAA